MLVFSGLMLIAWLWSIIGYVSAGASPTIWMFFSAVGVALPVAVYGYFMVVAIPAQSQPAARTEAVKKLLFDTAYLVLMITPGAFIWGWKWVIFLVPAAFLWVIYFMAKN
jgi:hypothetical protein